MERPKWGQLRGGGTNESKGGRQAVERCAVGGRRPGLDWQTTRWQRGFSVSGSSAPGTRGDMAPDIGRGLNEQRFCQRGGRIIVGYDSVESDNASLGRCSVELA